MEDPSNDDLLYMLPHVFLPPKLPQEDDMAIERDVGLSRAVYNASRQFAKFLPERQQKEWSFVVKMLKNLLKTTRALDKDALIQDILLLEEGDVLVFHIRAQNAALILRRREDVMIFEAFEVSPHPERVMQAKGKLICSYPGPAVQIPLEVARNPSFVRQLVSFLIHMDVDRLDVEETIREPEPKVPETRGMTHPRYITQLLMMILHGIGEEAEVNRVTKRIADEVGCEGTNKPWRRSGLWLVLRVAIQTSVEKRESYKAFMIFFQTELLRFFLKSDFPSDLIHAARVKTGRRIFKLHGKVSPRLLKAFQVACKTVAQQVQARWEDEQRLQSDSAVYTHDASAIDRATIVKLKHSREYLKKVMNPEAHTHTFATFTPSHVPRLRDTDNFATLAKHGMKEAITKDPYLALADFEWLVQERLDAWVSGNSHDIAACRILNDCMTQYLSAARENYAGIPELESLMLLTIMELWVALDTIAVKHCTLMALYSPEIPTDFLHPLLLRRAKSFERVEKIESYLQNRHCGVTVPISIFSSELEERTFAVQYFQLSARLQNLKASVESSILQDREAKKEELEQMNEKFNNLNRKISQATCYYFDFGGMLRHKPRSCPKCSLKRQVKNLEIVIHEWPLSTERPYETEAVLFELQCPTFFGIWRTRTYEILRDIGMAHVPSQSKFSPEVKLEEYDGLAKWCKKGKSGRLMMGSETEPFGSRLYRGVAIPAEEERVCVKSGLKWKLFDSARGENVISKFEIKLDAYCTLRVGERKEGKESLYGHLQYAVARTTHSHNETIVNQGDCPRNLSLHEQLAYSNLRCGGLLQWLNIVRELRTNILSFSREEVHTLLMQAAWQIGPLENENGPGRKREWHRELEVPEFGLVLFKEAGELLRRVEANWMEGVTVKSIIYLTTRLLASIGGSAEHTLVRQKAYELLLKAREVTHRWMREIVHKLQEVTDYVEANELQRRGCEIAATCRATFDVDPDLHLSALLSSSHDVAVLLECSIVVHDNSPAQSQLRIASKTRPEFVRLLLRDQRLSHLLEPTILALIHADSSGLDEAITSVWSGYRSNAGSGEDKGWKQLTTPNRRWLTSYTQPLAGQRAQQVHFNLLAGKLLVDGKPVGRLPGEVVDHPMYKRIFGQKILDVIPADMPGMDYASRSLVHGYQISFALREDSPSLIIRSRLPSGQIFELIPDTVLLKDFPTFFSVEHAHWMDVITGEVEFRPLDRLWEQSPQNWRLYFYQDARPSRVIHGPEKKTYLIDIQSAVFKDIAECIRPLESADYLSVVHDNQSLTTSIELLRFRLSFFVNDDGELESKNMPGMVVDTNQSSGTMIGLCSQLVLRHRYPTFAALPRSRCVLVPYGEVYSSISDDKHHVCVRIDTVTGIHFIRHVTWYKYEIDTDLGSLVGNVDLTSRLYCIYLHALCSHPLPDPLTSQTGTDYALQELRAAGCFSFQTLTEEDVKLLQLIGSLSPRRLYYPKNTRVVQSTKWSVHLPTLSQHGVFGPAISKIMEYARSLAIFNVQKEAIPAELEYKITADDFLMDRAIRRNVFYYEHGVDSEPASNFDEIYEARDSPHLDDHDFEGTQAMRTSRLVFAWPLGLTSRLHSPNELIDAFICWQDISGPIADTSLEYKQEWQSVALQSRWLTIYNLCHQAGNDAKKFELIFLFSFLAYSRPEFQKFIPMFLAFATMHDILPAPPRHSYYSLSEGFEPDEDQVHKLIVDGTRDFANSPAATLAQKEDEIHEAWSARRLKYYNDMTQPRIETAVEHLMAQANSSSPRSPFSQADDSRWFQTQNIMSRIAGYFTRCRRNTALRTFILQVTAILQSNEVTSPLTTAEVPRFHFSPNLESDTEPIDLNFTLEELFSSRTADAPVYMEHEFGANAPGFPNIPSQPINTDELKTLFSGLQRSGVSMLTSLYFERLEKSRLELHGQEIPALPHDLPSLDVCVAYRDQCRAYLNSIFSSICSALAPLSAVQHILKDSGLWPRIHPRSLLQPLRSTSDILLHPEWTKALIAYAEALIEYQHAQRLVTFSLRSEVDDFYKELQNVSYDKGDASEHPDWLLIQIQGNFLIRPIQSAVAAEMITPSTPSNTVLQLNMGEGKSHVIVPIVAVALANSQKLVRVVVLKPLASQMFHLLVDRISGLANRRIFYLPFSRDAKIGVQQITHIRNLFEECARVRGVLVTQPEHILSFRLMVIDRMLSSGCPLDDVAQGLYDVQEWLKSTARDILDESDELLHVRYQQIYTMNEQHPLDDGPDRWITTQKVLDLVRRHMCDLQDEFPDEVELSEHHDEGEAVAGAFAQTRLLGPTAALELVSRIAEDTADGRIDTLNVTGLMGQPELRIGFLDFIKKQDTDDQMYHMIEIFFKGSGLWKGILLLRGLLGHGILTYVLGKQRWRVDYGLDQKRSLLAVPYRAKDMPSLRSEFGHPDVAVCLTCLSYYYGGLNASQVRECFDLLLKLDNPPQEYEKWVRRGGMDVPLSLRQLIGVNTHDVQTFLNNVVPKFQHNQATVDFFLSQVVFPKEAKEFPHKLGTSGWDLVEEPVSDNYITGFSGTNDNSDLLPTSITQSDPVNQLKTNAQVLSYLLRPENNKYVCLQDMYGRPCSAMEFLTSLVREQEDVRVLLDVGAQMLEMTNQDLLKNWLSLRKDLVAGVFVDEEDRLSILSQDGVVESFYSSPFSQRLHQCLVYLDDAHTRGTDLKLPRNFRAVVTLGPKVTKDRLVQGCMRMRKLGHGQSVVFYAPPEIDRHIRESENINASCPVKVTDVLSWVMTQTCVDIEHHIPQWVQQGVDYHKRRSGSEAFRNSEMTDIEHLSGSWLQPARRSLDEMYGIASGKPPYDEAMSEIPALRERLEAIGIKTVRDAQMEEEQEREVSHEVEQERQLERPPKVDPATHCLYQTVSNFVKKGIMPPDSPNFVPLLKPLSSWTEKLSPANPWSQRLLGTRDFMRTTKQGTETRVLSDYLRPVHWILSHVPQPGGEILLVVLSPYEVNALLARIRKSKYVRLHVYAPRTIQSMKPMDDLLFYCIPPLPNNSASATPSLPINLSIRCQLNIWAGQLHFDTYDTYIHLCFLLGLSPNEMEIYEGIESDRFVPERGRIGDMRDLCLFNHSPVGLVRTLIGMRRKGMSFENSHMGKVLHARPLLPADFEEREEEEQG